MLRPLGAVTAGLRPGTARPPPSWEAFPVRAALAALGPAGDLALATPLRRVRESLSLLT